ncbi:MAG: hypothetical protein ABJ275_08415 [Maricaulaceae bacterium]
MNATFKYYLRRNYFLSILYVLLGIGSLYHKETSGLVLYVVLGLLFLIGGFVLFRKPRRFNKAVFYQINKMFGRSIIAIYLLAYIVANFIYFILDLRIDSYTFALGLSFIIAGFCAGFASYIQVRTLQATGLYDEVPLVTDRLQEV